MNKTVLSLFLLSLIFNSALSQRLPKHNRDSLKIELDIMGEEDQNHRWEIMYGTKNKVEIDSINDLPIENQKSIVVEHHKNNRQAIDSLWVIQKKIDIKNRDQLLDIITKFGFPSVKRTKSYTTNYILLHFLSEEDFKILNPVFLNEIEKGNMPGKVYASWFDRILFVSGEPQLYGEYISKYPCVENLTKTNEARKKIGLKKLKENKCK